jgi:hypothetical protein
MHLEHYLTSFINKFNYEEIDCIDDLNNSYIAICNTNDQWLSDPLGGHMNSYQNMYNLYDKNDNVIWYYDKMVIYTKGNNYESSVRTGDHNVSIYKTIYEKQFYYIIIMNKI